MTANDNQPPVPRDVDLKVALFGLIAQQATLVKALHVFVQHLEKASSGISLLASEIEKRSTANPDQPY